MPDAVAPKWMTQPEAASYLRISVRTFRNRLKSGHLPPGRASSSRRKLWSAEDLDLAITGHSINPTDPIMAAINVAEAEAAARGTQSR
jgi:hypothetical protein